MVTEVMEGLVYINEFDNLAVPLYETPFTNMPIGILLNKGQDEFLNDLNEFLQDKLDDGTIEEIKKIYSLSKIK